MRLLLLFVCCALLTMTGCAASSTTIIEEESVTNSKPMYRYTSLIIRDMELKSDQYDQGGSHYAELPGQLSGHIERYVRSHRTYGVIARDGRGDAATLVLTGRFLRVGRFKIAVAVSLRDGENGQEVAYFRQTLWDVLDAGESIGLLGRDIAAFIDRIQYK